MNKYGFKEYEWKEMLRILSDNKGIEKAILFGSRAMNTFKPMSDVDIVIYGDALKYSDSSSLIGDFEDSDLPYMFDIVNYNTIKSKDLLEHIEKYGVRIYLKGWMETTLGEVIKLVGGGTPKTSVNEYWNGNISWLSVVDFNDDNRWVLNTEKSITELGLKKSSTKLLNIGDIIISARETVGAIAQLKKKMAFNQSCYGIREIENVSDVNFLFYLTKYSLKQINRNTYGAVFDTITTKTFDVININLPPLPEQKAIANILTAFDDKIENLQAQNKILEQTAQTIFKEWFGKYQIGDELPKGWKVMELNEISLLSAGGDKPKVFSEEKNELCSVPIFSNGINKNGLYGYTDKAKIKEESVTISARGTIGFVCLRFEPYVPIVRLVVAIPKQEFISSKYLYLYLNNMKITGIGTTQQQLTVPAFKKEKVLVPTAQKMEEFTLFCNSVFDKIRTNLSQILTLKKTRDTLLPKLMSGALRVSKGGSYG